MLLCYPIYSAWFSNLVILMYYYYHNHKKKNKIIIIIIIKALPPPPPPPKRRQQQHSSSTADVDLLCIVKISPVTGLEWPRGFQEVKVPRFHDNGTERW